jgi:hypothetical protein
MDGRLPDDKQAIATHEPTVRPSLDIVDTEISRAFDVQQKEAESLDIRSTWIIGFAGLLVTLGGRGDGWLVAAGRFGAAIAAFSALMAVFPRRRPKEIPPTELNDQWAYRQAIETHPVVLMVRSRLYGELDDRLKRRRYAVAVAFTFLAISTWVITCAITLSGENGGVP